MYVFLRKFFTILIFSLLFTSNYAQTNLIFKVNPHFKQFCKNDNVQISSLKAILNNYTYKLTQLFPNSYMPDTSYIFFPYCTDLSTIYELRIYDSINTADLIRKISNLSEILYCHKKDYPELLESTNDPSLGAQYYLQNVKAFDAWNISKGDSTVVIGIIDTGVELAHDDLWENIAYNYADPIDGVDNDGDGFTDNYRGWDMGNNDNSPEWSENNLGANPHGVFVAGMAAPTTNNAIGIAGVAYKVRFLPVKIIDSMGVLSRSYEGVVYAADHGCKIINCSWGSPIPTEFSYDVIRYATYNRGCLVFAAAGNKGHTTNDIYYPAAYPEVMCVAATNQIDVKWNKSCYGYHVDVSAPGENVYSTFSNNGYTFGWGTSYASPLASSVAALAYSQYQKKINMFQLKAIVAQSTDIIDTIAPNQQFQNKLGKGRVNALKAVTQPIRKAVNVFNFQVEEMHDTIILTFSLINLFKPLQNLHISVSSDSNYLLPLNEINIQYIDSLEIIANNSLRCSLLILPQCPLDANTDLFIHVTDNEYVDSFHYRTTINKSYQTISNNNITLTVCSNGKVGYNELYPVQGQGILYQQPSSLVSDMGLFVYAKNTALWSFSSNRDFLPVQKVSIENEPDSLKAHSAFSGNAAQNNFNVSIFHSISLYKSDSLNDLINLQYKIINYATTSIDSFYIGLYADIDLYNAEKNVVRYDSLMKIIYVYAPYINGIHCGLLLPDKKQTCIYAVDNDGSNQSIKVTDGIDLNEIKQVIKQKRLSAGNTNGNDVSIFVGYGPVALHSNDTTVYNFMMILGKNYSELIQNAVYASKLFDTTIHVSNNSWVSTTSIYPNPTLDEIYLSKPEINVTVSIFNQLGQLVEQKFYPNLMKISLFHYPSGLYYISINGKKEKYSIRVLKK
ncbi:MAG: S8 family peptidase [Bacteroidales bacterium]|nr:S8 family peptidase [Bacteroidales bacterium]